MKNKYFPNVGVNIVLIITVVAVIFAGLFYFIMSDIQGQAGPGGKLTFGPDLPKAITLFNFKGLNSEVAGVITQENHTVTLTVPSGIDITNLVPTIEISSGATISPESNIGQNFSHVLIYTVTASNATHQDYTVDVVVADPTPPAITSFSMSGQVGSTVINQNAHTILLTVPAGISLSSLQPIIALIPGASISPASGVAQDFTKPVSYTAQSTGNPTQVYTVIVKAVANN